MFATLVVVLPSVYAGGELLIRHRGRDVSLPLACAYPSNAAFVAFYADCVHEVRPVTSGTRLTLVYNLIRSGKPGPASPPQYPDEQAALTAMLSQSSAALAAGMMEVPEKLVYPLEHVYSAAELGFDRLKNADAAAAKVLAAAAALAGCDIHLAQLAIDERASAGFGGYDAPRHSRYRHEDDQGLEVSEVFEHDATVSGWRHPDGSTPPIGELPLKEGELCPPDALDDADPDEQHFYEATGNEGASFERSYRRAALVLWPRAHRLAVINQGAPASTLTYLEELERSADAAPLALASLVVASWPERTSARGDDCARLLVCLCRLDARALLETFIGTDPATGRYDGAENAALAPALLLLLPAPRAAELIAAVIATNARHAPGACAELLALCCAGRDDAAIALAPADANPWRRVAPPDAALVVHGLTALQRLGDASLAGIALDHMLSAYCHCEHCEQLARFLADPVRARWTLKAAETHRRHVAASIAANHCDVDHVTVKRGSPHELVCTKNQASYQRRVTQRIGDLDAMRRLAANRVTKPS